MMLVGLATQGHIVSSGLPSYLRLFLLFGEEIGAVGWATKRGWAAGREVFAGVLSGVCAWTA